MQAKKKKKKRHSRSKQKKISTELCGKLGVNNFKSYKLYSC